MFCCSACGTLKWAIFNQSAFHLSLSPNSIRHVILEITSSLCDLAFSKDERMYLNRNKNSSESKEI